MHKPAATIRNPAPDTDTATGMSQGAFLGGSGDGDADGLVLGAPEDDAEDDAEGASVEDAEDEAAADGVPVGLALADAPPTGD